jgi:hypothetical protein
MNVGSTCSRITGSMAAMATMAAMAQNLCGIARSYMMVTWFQQSM